MRVTESFLSFFVSLREREARGERRPDPDETPDPVRSRTGEPDLPAPCARGLSPFPLVNRFLLWVCECACKALILLEDWEDDEAVAFAPVRPAASSFTLNPCDDEWTLTALPEISPTLFSHSGTQATASGVEHAMDFPNGTVAYAQSPFSMPVTKCCSKISRSR